MGIVYPLITFPYASRVLHSEGIGKVEFANSIITYFLLIAALGIASYGARELAQIRDNIQARNKLAKELFLLNLISTFAAYVLLIFALLFFKSLSEYRILLIVCSGKILFTAFGMEWLYTAFEEYDYITVRSVIFQAISLVLLFIFVKNEDDYIKYAAIGVFSNVGSNICNFLHSKKYISFFVKTGLELRKHLRSIFIFFGMGVAGYLYTALDTTMLGFLTDDATVGYYSAANKINRLILSVITAISAVLSPHISYLIGTSDDETKWRSLIERSVDFIICFSIPCVIGLIVLAPQLILLFCGDSFYPAVVPMQFLAPVLFFWSVASVLVSTVLSPFRMEKYILISQILGASINLVLNYFFIKSFGILGAIVSTLISEAAVTSVQFFVSRKFVATKHFLVNLLQTVIASAVMLIVIFFVSGFIKTALLNVILTSLSGIISYFFMLYILKNDFFKSVVFQLRGYIRK